MVIKLNELKKVGQEQKKERVSELEKELEDDIDRALVENQDRLKYTDSKGETHYDCIEYNLSKFCITNSSFYFHPKFRGEKQITAGISLIYNEREDIIKRVRKKYEGAGWYVSDISREYIGFALPEYIDYLRSRPLVLFNGGD